MIILMTLVCLLLFISLSLLLLYCHPFISPPFLLFIVFSHLPLFLSLRNKDTLIYYLHL